MDKKVYLIPEVEVIEIIAESVICESNPGGGSGGFGGGDA